ncbi:hypothetical protein [Providencia phage PSTCR6]|nr:hypothetical protein [Providencia phage PSTCR6]
MKIEKKVNLELVGLDSNAFSILGAFSRQARREGWTSEEIDFVLTEAKKGDYDHLLATIYDYCDPSEEDESERCAYCGEYLDYCECDDLEDW